MGDDDAPFSAGPAAVPYVSPMFSDGCQINQVEEAASVSRVRSVLAAYMIMHATTAAEVNALAAV